MNDLRIDLMAAGIGIFLLIVVLSVYRMHRDPSISFNLFDLVFENGKLSKISCAFMAALALTSWMMVYLTLSGKMTEGYFGLYGSMWVTALVARVIFGKQELSTVETLRETSKTTTVPALSGAVKPPVKGAKK